MEFRFRRSINLGGGFKINLSKSGIGYSWGTKGYRISRTAHGTTRRTYSIPGTDISYVDESGSRSRNRNRSQQRNQNRITQSTQRQIPQSTYNQLPERAIALIFLNSKRLKKELFLMRWKELFG